MFADAKRIRTTMIDIRHDEHSARSTPEWRTAVRYTITQEIEDGCSEEEAARRSGIHPQTHWRWRHADAAYDSRVRAARAESIRRIKATVLTSMRKGLTFGQSCKDAGREPGTLRAWRRQDAAFDAKVRALIERERLKRARVRAMKRGRMQKRETLTS